MIYNNTEVLFPVKQEGARTIQQFILSGRYQILSELGRGSGSIVYLARHQKLGEYRAVKLILKQSDSAWKIREASILNRLKHPQIPHIYDVEEDEEAYYIIEEYFEGESLEAYMLQSPFITPDFIYHIISEVADILDYMHQQKPDPIIYQDLKAEHVMLCGDGVKLIDFDIAADSGMKESKFQNYGTPKFCAPEKAQDAVISIQTDIYSIGKLLEEMLGAQEKDESRYLMHIAKKAQSFDLTERYASISEFRSDLTAHMQSEHNQQGKKHLLKKIVAAGSQPRMGTTHLSISLTSYLNQKNSMAVYREKNSSEMMRKIIQTGGFTEEGGLYRRGDFSGMPAYGDGVEVQVPKDAVEILDYGTDLSGALSEEADLFFLLMGSREWETAYAHAAFAKAAHAAGLICVVNYGARQQARRYARICGRTVYCFPLDQNPFLMTKEKERLFEGLLEKYWNCGKHPRQWSNALVRGIGKLCGKRAW